MLIAIDGPAASGKGTVSKQIAKHYGLEYLDTGRLYRLVGWELLRKFPDMNKVSRKMVDRAEQIARELDTSNINSERIETEKVGRAASIVSAIPEVRAALLDLQRNVARSKKGAVLDGRDIGTIICPNADYKFFITADAKVRAKRRYLQLKGRKKKVKESDILKDILSRDERDRSREIAPLVPALDAIYIDTTKMTVKQVFDKVKSVIQEKSSC